MNLTLNIKTVRKQKKISREKLSELTGIHVKSLERLERNVVKYISLTDLSLISKALSCNWQDLISEENINHAIE